MMKLIISVYIAAILLCAGFAEAASFETTPLNFDRVNHNEKIWLNVMDAKFDSRREILTLSGKVSPECLNSVNSELQFDERTNTVLVSVTADGINCLADANSHYEIVIDLKAYFTENTLREDGMIHFQIDNYTAGEFGFNYLAKKQVAYAFDKVVTGQIVFDERTQKFYLVNADVKIEILSRFGLADFVNTNVQLKGLIPTQVNIGDDMGPVSQKLFIGKLIAIR